MGDNDISIEDGEGFKLGADFGIQQIGLEQFRRCIAEGSKEMQRGGIQTKIIKGNPVDIEVGNQREIFINSVKMMAIVLEPEFDDEPKILKEIQKIDVEISNIEYEFSKSFKILKMDWQKKKFDWNKAVSDLQDQYERSVLTLYHQKLIILSKLLKNINYYGEGTY